jgi:hypothetical protein
MDRAKISALKKLFLPSIAGVLFLTGCSSTIPYSKALIDEYKLTPSETKQLQFFISDGVLLEREQMSIDKDIDESYSLKKVEDRYIKQIKFRRLTPCIVTSVEGDHLRVALEPKDQLAFDLKKGHRHGSVFVYKPDVLFTEPEHRPRSREAGFYGWVVMGTEDYEQTKYDVLCRRSLPILMVDERSLRKLVIDARIAPGMRQSDLAPKTGK